MKKSETSKKKRASQKNGCAAREAKLHLLKARLGYLEQIIQSINGAN
ncbi:hypothetical protein ACXUPC_22565 [Pseudomonas marginalis]|jgi:hypothetical protein